LSWEVLFVAAASEPRHARRCGARLSSPMGLERGRSPRRLWPSYGRPAPVPAALSGIEALTPTERRIAQLAATGRANPQIAKTLYITTKTVEWHLSHVYSKLDITSRDGLPGALSAVAAENPREFIG
jgi:DNA-binding CsgD family transcriptional regulator